MTLEAQSLTVAYGARTACRDVELHCAAGAVTALCGPNGAGKTSLLKGLLGLVPATGRVAVDGRDLAGLDPRERARRVAYVPQRSRLAMDLAVHEVVAQGRYAHADRRGEASAVTAALADCDIPHLAERSFLTLSGGEQQLVLIARALATGAPWLLVDEPTAALDVAHALRVLRHLARLAAAGRGVLCVLHRLDEVLIHASAAVLLEAGTVVASGEPADVLSAERLRAVYGVEAVPGGATAFRLAEEEA